MAEARLLWVGMTINHKDIFSQTGASSSIDILVPAFAGMLIEINYSMIPPG
jgi:hypothetical protein